MRGTLNSVILVGKVANSPVMKESGGWQIGEVTINTYRMKGSTKQGNQTMVTDAITVTCFGKIAEFCRDALSVGDAVVVQGSLQSNNWIDKNGNQKTITKLVSSSIELVAEKKEGKKTHASVQHNKGNTSESGGDDFTDDIPF